VKPAAPPAGASHAAAKPDAPKPVPATAASHSDWFVQMDSFKSKENADRLVTKLKAAGYSAFELSPQAGVSPYYRVQIGPFPDHPEADKVASRLTKEGYKPSVTR
jgi:cell division septation protein DedD